MGKEIYLKKIDNNCHADLASHSRHENADRTSFVRNEEICHPDRQTDLCNSGFINVDGINPLPNSNNSHSSLRILPSHKERGHEGNAPSPNLGEGWGEVKRKIAFTLAEVLITLGIIGVVAALTLPSLISNYQKQAWVTQLKKDVNYVQNTVKMVLGQEGVDYFFQTSLFTMPYVEGIIVGCVFNPTELNDKYLKLQVVSKNSEFSKYLNESRIDATGFVLNDGSCISIDSPNQGMPCGSSSFAGIEVDVDVNCDKKPNEFGRDRFQFLLDSYGNLRPSNNARSCVLADIKDDVDSCKAAPDCDLYEAIEKPRASACFTKIFEDGWQMKY